MSKKNRKSNPDKPSRSKKDRDSEESDMEMTSEEFDPQATWDCTVCTFKNRFEAFKCEICDTRKGTSTRKPRVNMNVVQQQQILVQTLAINEGKALKRHSKQGMAPDSPQSMLGGVPSSSNLYQMEIDSPCSPSTAKEADPICHKREKIRDSLVLRDVVKKYDITDADGTVVNFTVLKSKQLDKEIQLVSALRVLDNCLEQRTERIEKARAAHQEAKKLLEEERTKQRRDRENRPKRPKRLKIKKIRKSGPSGRGGRPSGSGTKPPGKSTRGRPPNKQPRVPTKIPKAGPSKKK
uniref:RanBP2-type domain-containing protein n=1 Tax=Panagrolaimus sp. JU765 TaxID=591449 RepID=A0AC34RJX3_9BILA